VNYDPDCRMAADEQLHRWHRDRHRVAEWLTLPEVRKLLEKSRDDVAIERDAQAVAMRKRLWLALNEIVTPARGRAVSVPGTKRVRIEVPEGNDLAGKLADLGYAIDHRGIGMRTVGMATHSFVPVEIIEITLPR